MRIKRLKLTGFKSFVEPSELRIEPGLTGIVGPNGCGKSNLLEAIRWTMGESSPKSLRGGGMEDVIFAGTATRPARDFAEVTILAELPDGALSSVAGDGDEVEVVRRIERGAGSAYRVNGRDVRAKDVALIFADAATGAHSPALVSQGRIGSIISAKPAERRAMLEEAAGISGLHVRRKDAEQKLRATETNLTRVDDNIAEMEQRIGALKRQARAAEKYQKLTESIELAEGRLIFVRWREAAAAAEQAREEARAATEAVEAARTLNQDKSAAQEAAVQTLAATRADALRAREAARDAEHALSRLRAERDQIVRRIEELGQRRRGLETDRTREASLAGDARDALKRLAEEIAALETSLAERADARPQLLSDVEAAGTEARKIGTALADAVARHAGEEADLRVARAALDAAAQRKGRAERDLEQVGAELTGLGDAAPLEAERNDAAANKAATEARVAELSEQAPVAELAVATARDARDTARDTLGTRRAELASLASEKSALERALASRGGSASVVTDIIVASGYERALAAALGDDLEASSDEGDERHWIGSGSGEGPNWPAGTDLLLSHVDRPGPLAARLAQVAVLDNDDGRALAVGQRLVTLDGRMRRWDGFVASGDGAMAAETLVRRNRLAELETVQAGAVAAIEAAETAFASAQATLADAEATQSTLMATHRDANQAVGAAEAALVRAETAIERRTTLARAVEDRLARARADLDAATKDNGAAQGALSALPDGVAAGAEVDRLRSEADAKRIALAEVEAKLTAHDRDIAAAKDRKMAAGHEHASWEARAGDAARRLDDLEKRSVAAEAEEKSLLDAPEQRDAEIVAVEQDVERLARDAAALADAEREAEDALRLAEQAAHAATETMAGAREIRAGAEARAEAADLRRVEMGRISGERFECPPPILPEKLGFDESELGTAQTESERLDKATQDRERLGPVNLVAATELVEVEAEHLAITTERDELVQAIHRLRGSIGNLNREGRVRLLAAFEAVNEHFKRLFTTLFAGGQAHLALIESDDPLEAGLEIYAQPPGKKLAALTLLSGGEQALTSIALIFGLFLTNPAPICVLDEVDAPLDDANIERFCDLLDRMREETDTRYLIVTHNAVTMSRLDRLFGVTMIEHGVSRLVSVDLGGAEQLLAAE